MDEPLSLTLLYTGEIAGDLALLPRLFTFLQQLKSEARSPVLLLDLGGSCAADVPHCRDTGGRSTLIALDGMAYHAANTAGLLEREQRQGLAEQVTLGLVDEERDWHCRLPPLSDLGIRVRLRSRTDSARLQILLRPAESTRIEGNTLHLRSVRAGQVGAVALDLRGQPKLLAARIHEMPATTPPNPSIAGTVEFVEAEARLLRRKRLAASSPGSIPFKD